MRILGLDQSLTRCGWCLLSGTRAQPQFEYGSWSSDHATHFGVKLIELLAAWQPDFVVFERPVPRVFIYGKRDMAGATTTPNADQLVLPRLAGMIEMACLDRSLPYEEVASNTWRARVMGKGAGNLPTKKAKLLAVQYAKQLGIQVKNADQAEAALIALYGLSSDTYRLLQTRSAISAQNVAGTVPQSSGE